MSIFSARFSCDTRRCCPTRADSYIINACVQHDIVVFNKTACAAAATCIPQGITCNRANNTHAAFACIVYRTGQHRIATRATRAAAVDMFPRTANVETVVALERPAAD